MGMSSPFVSIVIPAYNASKYIRQTLQSVLSQSFTDFEVVVVDDCSNDDTIDIAGSLAATDNRIRIIQNPENMGVSHSRNTGVESAKSDWIAFVDADDMWEPDKLESQLSLLAERQDADIIYTGSRFIDENSAPLSHTLKVPEQISYRKLLPQNVISCSSVLVKKSAYLRYGMQNDAVHEDFALWLRLLRDGCKAYGINRPLLIYRVTAHSRSGNKLNAARMTFGVYRYLRLNIPTSCFYFVQYAFRNLNKYRLINKQEN